MCSAFARKGTILIPAYSTPHLHFVCNDPVFYPNKGKECVLLVNISSIKQNIPYDNACILNMGDHPFITKPSFVYYRMAEIYSIAGIQQQIAEGNYSVREDCSDTVFQKILGGFDKSGDVKFKIHKFYEKYCQKQLIRFPILSPAALPYWTCRAFFGPDARPKGWRSDRAEPRSGVRCR